MTSQFRTFALLALLSGLILFLGRAFGGSTGLFLAGILALVMNVGSYWFSDKIVLAAYKARELAPEESPVMHRMVEELAREAGIPKPRICVIPDDSPNAFATGRNPENAVVAVTQGIMRLLSPEELRGVLAHEMAHVLNRDILVQTIASVMGTVVMYLANMMQWMTIFGGARRSSEEEGGGGGFGMVGGLLLAFLAPVAASLIQFAISRSREYLADATGARLSGSPQSLASALAKLDAYSRQIPMQNATPATESMFIVTPFAGGGVTSLFMTHPPIQDRIARLNTMARTGSYEA